VKIDDSVKKNSSLGVGTTPARSGKAADKGPVGATTGPSATQGDSVHLSTKLEGLAASGGNAVFDAKKVEEIKAAIAEGRFQVNPEKVADGLLDTVTDLIHSRKR